jgi:hypothetical protein
MTDRDDILARVERRMLERDDEDLAVEQLPGAGRADDHELAEAKTVAHELPQERAAALADLAQPAAATPAHLRELSERIEQLQSQLQALPIRKLEQIDYHEERFLTLSTQRERFSAQLSELPEPTRRRFGREHDPHAEERAQLIRDRDFYDDGLRQVIKLQADIEAELGNPQEIRAERVGLVAALRQSLREHSAARDELAERGLLSPGAWARETFGERPDRPGAIEAWEKGVRRVAAYRAEHGITDPNAAIGPRPGNGRQQADWERVQREIERTERRLGRSVGVERDGGIDIGF